MKKKMIIFVLAFALAGVPLFAAENDKSAEQLRAYNARIEALKAAPPDDVELVKLSEYLEGIHPIKDAGWTFSPEESWECYKDARHPEDMYDSEIESLQKKGISRAHLMPPCVIREFIACSSDHGEGVWMVDPSQGNRFFTDWKKIETEQGADGFGGWVKEIDAADEGALLHYRYIGSFSNGVHVLEIIEESAASWWSYQLIFLVFERVKTLSFQGNAVVLRTLGSRCGIARSAEEVLDFSLKDDVLTLDIIHNQAYFGQAGVDPSILKRSVLKVMP